jgi:vancomycin permeability regulator SanA
MVGGLLLDLHWVARRFPAHAQGRIQEPASAVDLHGPILVLGAGVYSDGEPTQVLEARLRGALDLYLSGKGTWFLVSGDNRSASYNEPAAMKRWLVKQGVPTDRIVLDFAGRRTYDSLKRARLVFGVGKAYLVTSDFHLPRALYLAHHLGLDAIGVASSTGAHTLGARASFWAREVMARHKALFDLWFPPDVVLGPQEPTPDHPALPGGAPGP